MSTINCVKSFTIRIGPRHNRVSAQLILCGRPLVYVSSIKCICARTFIWVCSYEYVK